mgnify:FL=1
MVRFVILILVFVVVATSASTQTPVRFYGGEDEWVAVDVFVDRSVVLTCKNYESRVICGGYRPQRVNPRYSDGIIRIGTPGEYIETVVIGGTRDDTVKLVYPLSNGKILIYGSTRSPDLPVTTDAQQPTYGGGLDAFIAVVVTGTITYCSYLGGTGDDEISLRTGTFFGDLVVGNTTSFESSWTGTGLLNPQRSAVMGWYATSDQEIVYRAFPAASGLLSTIAFGIQPYSSRGVYISYLQVYDKKIVGLLSIDVHPEFQPDSIRSWATLSSSAPLRPLQLRDNSASVQVVCMDDTLRMSVRTPDFSISWDSIHQAQPPILYLVRRGALSNNIFRIDPIPFDTLLYTSTGRVGTDSTGIDWFITPVTTNRFPVLGSRSQSFNGKPTTNLARVLGDTDIVSSTYLDEITDAHLVAGSRNGVVLTGRSPTLLQQRRSSQDTISFLGVYDERVMTTTTRSEDTVDVCRGDTVHLSWNQRGADTSIRWVVRFDDGQRPYPVDITKLKGTITSDTSIQLPWELIDIQNIDTTKLQLLQVRAISTTGHSIAVSPWLRLTPQALATVRTSVVTSCFGEARHVRQIFDGDTSVAVRGTWTKDGRPQETEHVLRSLEGLSRADTGNYSVVLVDDCGRTTGPLSFRINVESPGPFRPLTLDSIIDGGETIVLTVPDTDPTWRYRWFVNGIGIVGATGPTHTISPARKLDTGAYTCIIITEKCGSVESGPVYLRDRSTVAVHEDQESSLTILISEGELRMYGRDVDQIIDVQCFDLIGRHIEKRALFAHRGPVLIRVTMRDGSILLRLVVA